SEIERTSLEKDKTGIFTGLYAINPGNKERIPVWVADYVIGWYGKGAVMVVPAHDQRDFEFAKKYNLKIKKVIEGENTDSKSYEGEGKLIDSGGFSGMNSDEAKKAITEWIEKQKIGKKTVQFKLRDWVFSRQHYWGEPIPVIYCEKCGIVPVPEKDLPVELPYLEKYEPSGTGKSPLAKAEDWVNVSCPKCGGKAKRETDTMPNWAGSNWYFLRYLDPENDSVLADREKMDYWMPVDLYQGGFEHTTLHLLYSRFVYKFLHEIGAVPGPEPYAKRRVHGIVLGPDGKKMSKSLGNVINPDQIVGKFGADTLRVYEMFMGPFDQTIAWSEEGVEGSFRFLKRVWALSTTKIASEKTSPKLYSALQKSIKKVGEDIEGLKFNTAVASMMEFINKWQEDEKGLEKEDLKKFLLILAPIAPHMTEELWERIKNHESRIKSKEEEKDKKDHNSSFIIHNSIHEEKWPEFDEAALEENEVFIAIQVNGKLRETITIQKSNIKDQKQAEDEARKRENVQKYLSGKKIVRVIYIEGKILNFVVAD
ncbi:class I tRNA ligase family protein, partial [Patescibacteria group bacterium]|nr:class I tRNA ligase family protein [Patescibacteria group bacterium]